MKTTVWLIVTCLLLAVVGCSSSSQPNANSQNAASGPNGEAQSVAADSPQAAFDQFSAAIGNDDWKSAVGMITEESQEMIVIGMVMQATFMTMEDESKGKQLEELFKKHGFTEEAAGGGPEAKPGDLNLNEVVDDLPTFTNDLMVWIKANSSEDDEGFPKLNKLTDLKVDGDTATGMAEAEGGGGPIEFRNVDGVWKVHLATGPPPEPSLDELGLDFQSTGEGQIGSLRVGEKTSGLNHALAYHAKFIDQPCIVLVLSAEEIAAEKLEKLEADLKEMDGDASFFANGPHVQLTLSPSGELMTMFAWIDNSSMNTSRGPALDLQIEGGKISGRAGMAPKDMGGEELEFVATFDTEIKF